MSNIHILTNPLSGKNRKHPTRFDSMMRDVKRDCAQSNTLTVHKPEGLDALLSAVQTIKESQADILCIHGGDGTVHQVFTALWKVYGDQTPYPKIAILKGGTMNNVARSVGIGLWTSAKTLLIKVAKNDTVGIQIRHPLIVNNERSGFIYGNVGITPFLQEYYTGTPPSPTKGFLMFCKIAGSALFNTTYSRTVLAPIPMTITIDGNRLPDASYTLLGISTVADIGFYFRPFYQTLSHNNILQLISTTCPPLNIVKVLHRLILGYPTNKAYILDQTGQEIHFEYPTPQISTIDGDVYPPCSSETLRVGPAVQFLHP